ncbi:MAG: hypothetical protein AB1492_00500 [Bacillota bacterium]
MYDPALNAVEARFEVPQQDGSWLHGVRVLQDTVLVKLTDCFFVVDRALALVGSATPLPEPVKQALSGNGFRGAYDVSVDLTRIDYTDQDGLHLHDLDSGQTQRLSGHIQVGDRLLPQAYILTPHFSRNDEAVIAMLSGYEGCYGLIALRLRDQSQPYVYKNPELYYGIGWMNARYPYADLKPSWSPAPPKLALMDLEALASSGPAPAHREVVLASPSEQQPIGYMEYLPLFNADYFVYVALAWDPDGAEEKHVYRIVRVDLETMQAETLLTIRAGTPYLRALTADGRVMFSYNFKRKIGFAITGK